MFTTRKLSIVALEHVDLRVRDGEFLVLLGPSGCGKTTLLMILAQLETPTAGKVTFHGERKAQGPLSTLVWQRYALFPWRSVRDNVAFGCEVRGMSRRERYEKAQYFIDLVNLQGFENHYPHELSGGMMQRVALARSLCNDPEVLLMDEPLAALDAQLRTLMQVELENVCGQFNKTIVYVTHSIEEAILLGDRIVVMTIRPGKIKEILEMPFPRPRTLEILKDPRFHELSGIIWDSIREELVAKVEAPLPGAAGRP